MPSHKFEVQTHMFGGWENCWAVDGEPEYFDTEQEALDEIDEFFADLQRAGMSHHYDPDDYRVVLSLTAGLENR
jgi:hypothetical protein